MGKKKKPEPEPPKVIRSDPATVNRLLSMLPVVEGDEIPLRKNRRYRTPTPHNQTHPYQGGSPGQGKGA